MGNPAPIVGEGEMQAEREADIRSSERTHT
jgi:hypothetical protein